MGNIFEASEIFLCYLCWWHVSGDDTVRLTSQWFYSFDAGWNIHTATGWYIVRFCPDHKSNWSELLTLPSVPLEGLQSCFKLKIYLTDCYKTVLQPFCVFLKIENTNPVYENKLTKFDVCFTNTCASLTSRLYWNIFTEPLKNLNSILNDRD